MTRPVDVPVDDAATRWVRRQGNVLAVLLLLVVALAGAAYALAGQPGLPARFSYDADRIAYLAQPGGPLGFDRSFESVADVYAALGLAQDPGLAGLVTYLVFVAVVLAALTGRDLARLRTLVGASAVLVLGAIFLGQYSKDVFPALLVLVLVVAGRSLWGDVVMVAAMAGYAVSFRTYWLLVLALFVGARWFFGRHAPSARRLLAFAVLSVVALAVVVPLGTGQSLGSVRESVNVAREGSADAATLITPYLAGDSMPAEAANTFVTLLGFLVPVPLASLLTPYHLVVALVIFAFWATLLVEVRRRSASDRPLDTVEQRALALLVAFTLVQAVFEPDYGSYLRHLLPLTPCALILLLPRVGSPHPDEVTADEPVGQRPTAHQRARGGR